MYSESSYHLAVIWGKENQSNIRKILWKVQGRAYVTGAMKICPRQQTHTFSTVERLRQKDYKLYD